MAAEESLEVIVIALSCLLAAGAAFVIISACDFRGRE